MGFLAGSIPAVITYQGGSFAAALILAPVAGIVLGALMVFSRRTRWLAAGLIIGSVPGAVQVVALIAWLIDAGGGF